MGRKPVHELLLDSEAALRLITAEVADGLLGLEEAPVETRAHLEEDERRVRPILPNERLQLVREINAARDRLRESRGLLNRAPANPPRKHDALSPKASLFMVGSAGAVTDFVGSVVCALDLVDELENRQDADSGERAEEIRSSLRDELHFVLDNLQLHEKAVRQTDHATLMLGEVERRLGQLLQLLEAAAGDSAVQHEIGGMPPLPASEFAAARPAPANPCFKCS